MIAPDQARCAAVITIALIIHAVTAAYSDEQTLYLSHSWPNASQLTDGRYRDLGHSGEQWYGSTFFTGPNWTRVGKDWHHPGEQTPSVRCFVAPADGEIEVTGRVFKLHRDGDGIRAILRHNDRDLWQAEIDGDDGDGVEHCLKLRVRRGDRIRFVVHKRNTIFCDTTGWDPAVRYSGGEMFQASTAFAEHRQGAAGWRYEMESDATEPATGPSLYGWTPDLALRSRQLSPGESLTWESDDLLPFVVVADAKDERGLALAVAGAKTWRFVAAVNARGDLQLDWHGPRGEDPALFEQPYTGRWVNGWKAVDRCLADDLRFASLRHVVKPTELALRAMVQADWWLQDSISQQTHSYAEATRDQLKRTRALLTDLQSRGDVSVLREAHSELEVLEMAFRDGVVGSEPKRTDWLRVRRLKRRIALANPLLDFGPLLVCKRVPPSWSHLVAQYFGWRQRPGGGLFVVERPGHSLKTREILKDQLPDGSVLEPRLAYDAKHILFAHVACDREVPDPVSLPVNETGTNERYFHLYEVAVDGSGLRQLTDGPYDDMMAEYLPEGGIVFCSTRRRGYSRCFGPEYSYRWHSYTLHRMNADGSGIRPLSYNDVSEWFPAVSHSGHILHARWDYIDRDAVTHQNLWAIRPDGTNPVAVWGNATPKPHCVFQARPVPNSHKIVFTASAHHSITAGPICLLDPTIDADSLDAVTRITPLPFPEAEGQLKEWYATPWPLSEDYFLVAYSPYRLRFQGEHEHDPNPDHALGVYLLDSAGNRELLYRDPEIGTSNPIPLASRPRPPVLPEPSQAANTAGATMIVTDIYQGLGDVPRGTIKQLRVVQLFPKTTWLANQPRMGVAGEENGRAVLGTVPVEADGSAYFEVPAATPISFHALDEHGMAYQTMRSLTFAQPGECTSCIGCHEHRRTSPSTDGVIPEALRRPPSEIDADDWSGRPFGYAEFVQPVLDQHCVRCHGGDAAEANLDLTGTPHQGFTRSYISLCGTPESWSSLQFDPLLAESHLVPRFVQRNRIQRTPPGGAFGARGSRLIQMLLAGHEGVELADGELRRLAMWVDLNAIFYGVYDPAAQARQLRGEPVAMPELR